MDAMDNEEALRLLVQRKLGDGRLPHDRFTTSPRPLFWVWDLERRAA
jgi:hypothetical protein